MFKKVKGGNEMGCSFGKEDNKTFVLMVLIVAALFALIIMVLITEMSYELTLVEVGETKLLPVSNDDGYLLFYGVEDRFDYFVQVRNGDMVEKILLPKRSTNLIENSTKAVLKEYATARVPKNQFYDFLFVNNDPQARWEICIP